MSPVEFEQRYIELLGELKADVRHLYDDHRDQEKAITTILQDVSALKTEVSGLKRTASMWGGGMGAVAAAVVAVVKYLID